MLPVTAPAVVFPVGGVVELVDDPAREPVPLVLIADQPQAIDFADRPLLIVWTLGLRMQVPADVVGHGMPERTAGVVGLGHLGIVGVRRQLHSPPQSA